MSQYDELVDVPEQLVLFDCFGYVTPFYKEVADAFLARHGARLGEAMFRVAEDPEEYETYQVAKEELVKLARIALDKFGIGSDSFAALLAGDDPSLTTVGPDGNTFMDTPEGRQTYFGGELMVTANFGDLAQ